MTIISLKELQALLAECKGAKIVTLTTITEPDLIKKNNPYKGIRKIQRINGIINFNYSKSVNKQREREDKDIDFVAAPRMWGTKLIGLPFVSHVKKDGSNELYLEMKVERVFEEFYKDENGKIIFKEELLPFLKEKKSNKEHQGVDKEIILRDFNVKNIVTIDIEGLSFIIRI